MVNKLLDVAIVGGGVSGVYSGWRLLTEGKASKVGLFEASERIGGRLLSVTPPGIPDMKAELGGMRILPAVQPRITALIEVLNHSLPKDQQIETYPFPVDKLENISYLRGEHLRLKGFADPAKVPYNLTFQERGKTSSEIIVNALDQIVPGITNKKLTEEERRRMCQQATFAGQPLYKQGFWQVLLRVISYEAYLFSVDTGGYQSTLSNWNAADAIPWYLSDFGVDPKYLGFSNGFEQVPEVLAEKFADAGGTTYLETPLRGFDWDDSAGEVKLRFRNRPPVRAKALILAMPRRALELITPGSPLLKRKSVQGLVRSVTPRPLFKLFTTYDDPWWIPAGVEEGRTTTDLPVRQTYYWPKDDGSPSTSGRSMLMASYDDGTNVGFWDGFRPRRGQRSLVEAAKAQGLALFEGPGNRRGQSTEWNRHRAPKAMVEEVERQLQVVHGLSFTPRVVDACFMDWGDDPYGGGWNSWNIGVQSQKIFDAIVQPAANEEVPVYICGEAYSNAQGWVEGALETADHMLERFGVSPLNA